MATNYHSNGQDTALTKYYTFSNIL